MTEQKLPIYDTVAIEQRARQLRAEAFAAGIRAFRDWIRGRRAETAAPADGRTA